MSDDTPQDNTQESAPAAPQHPRHLPIVALRDMVVFPAMAASLLVGREDSILAVNAALKENRTIALFTQKDPETESPELDDLYDFGIEAKILQYLKMPDGAIKVLVEGQRRMNLHAIISADVRRADADYRDSSNTGTEDIALSEGLLKRVLEKFAQYGETNSKVSDQFPEDLLKENNPEKISDFLAQILPAKLEQKQSLLATLSVSERLAIILEIIENEMSIQLVERKIRGRVKNQMERSQKDFYLNEQIKAIKKELGEGEGERSELEELEQRIVKTAFPTEVAEKAMTEFKRLKNMSAVSAEATVIRTYLDWLLDVPWDKQSRLKHDIRRADKVLKADHYGLNKVRERILEHLAVQARSKNVRGSILCFVGPPGVGKTSLGKSIAKATGREFVRMALGGVRDESEIRGHRRTYIGAMPGRIIQAMKKAGTNNPLILLDEIDKLGGDFRGDPSSALLEVLDPEQNKNFNDHYLEVDYDLSKVLFVTTANSLDIPSALRDRMEIISIEGYTEEEKCEIAKRHLIARITKESGLRKKEWNVSPQVITDVIRYFTREAGVRGLERELRKLARKSVKILLESKARKSVNIRTRNLHKFLGARKYRFRSKEDGNVIGVVNGLAWSQVGGDILSIEAVAYPGNGKFSKTGKLGEVMKESVEAAEHLLRHQAMNFGISRERLKETSVHVHVPEGATPKDGPSAGMAMTFALISVLSEIPIRQDVAMTGEITLRGKVLEIGGLKLKLLAAARGGISKVLIPEDNRKDLEEMPASVLRALEIIPVRYLEDALPHVLEFLPQPIVEDVVAAEASQNPIENAKPLAH